MHHGNGAVANRKMKRNIPGVLKVIHEDVDEASYTTHYNMLICMITSLMLFLGAAASFVVRYFFINGQPGDVIFDSAILIILGAGFELFLRTKIKDLPNSAHIISLAYSFVFLFIMIRFYQLIGPSVWVLGLVQILFSMGQSSPVMLRYIIGSMSLSIVYVVFFTDSYAHEPFYNVMLAAFFVLASVVATIVYRVMNLRNSKIRIQFERIQFEREQRKLEQKKNLKLSFYDAATGLPNMALLGEKLSQSLFFAKNNAENVYLLIVNTDMLKTLNYASGYSTGEELLKSVGQRLSAISGYSFVARAGGDQFAIIIQGKTKDSVIIDIAERILLDMDEILIVGQHKFSLSCSIGISRFPFDGGDAETLVKCAELAMNSAKDGGAGRYEFYTEDMGSRAQAEADIIGDMREALNNGEFTLYYQPQINSASKTIIGFEALIRWNHPVRGLLMPGAFIPAAEKSGLITAIGEWAVWAACAQNKAWQDEGFVRVPVAVNVSSKQIYEDHAVECLSKALSETGLDPEFLELEITERTLIKDLDKAAEVLHNIKRLGVKLAIDDFGTGYSSIYYLKQLPIDLIKIPMEFVHGIGKNVKDESIISVILGLADNLNMDVIAEGVETVKQLEFLTNNLCRGIQGYYFGRPIEADKVRQNCRRNKKIIC